MQREHLREIVEVVHNFPPSSEKSDHLSQPPRYHERHYELIQILLLRSSPGERRRGSSVLRDQNPLKKMSMKLSTSLALLLLAAAPAFTQPLTPEITSWIINTTGQRGYNNILSNVQQIRYSAQAVYVSCTCIPGYDIGPWQGNPNQPANQNFVFRIPRMPERAAGAHTPTPLGHIGVWTNGVSIFNAKDARSYMNRNIWNQNAIVVEGPSFDACLGHPAGNGEYHHHLNPRCLYDDQDSSRHSPLIGFAFDGFPIYGAYGYAHADGTGGITRIRSSYRRRSIIERRSLAGGAELPAADHGPPLSPQYPLGYYLEDHEYVQGLGDLDEHNGRHCITPEYPQGTYAYFVTLDVDGAPAYPYVLGPTYYGTVPAGNTGPGSGHNVPTEGVTIYTPSAGIEEVLPAGWEIYPNPARRSVMIEMPATSRGARLSLLDMLGEVRAMVEAEGTIATIPLDGVESGGYFVRVECAGTVVMRRIVVAR